MDVALEERDVTLLVKLLRMLGAPSVGERAAAALKVSEFVESRGLDWADLILPEGSGGMPDVQVTVAGEAPPRPTDPLDRAITPAMRAQYQAWKQQAAAAKQAMNAQQAVDAALAAQQAYNHGLWAAMNAAAQAPFTPYPGPQTGLGQQAYPGPQPGVGSRRIWNGPAQPPPPTPTPTPPPGQQSGVLKDWREAVVAITTYHASVLRGSKEEQFLEDMLRRKYPLTQKQAAWLRDIGGRAGLTWT